jgi:hypothetical protein
MQFCCVLWLAWQHLAVGVFKSLSFRVCVSVLLWVLGFVSCRPNSSVLNKREDAEVPLPAAQRGPAARPRALSPEEERQQREEESKRQVVVTYPEIGVAGTAVNREFVRRYKLYQSVNPAFFDEPDWPKRLAQMLALDLGLDPHRSGKAAATP